MKPTPAARDDFQPGPLGLWALGLAGATRSRFREECMAEEVGDEVVAEGEETEAFASAEGTASHHRDS
jgi:hypothetical protein